MSKLEKAIENIDHYGWQQGAFQRRDGRLCAMGALRMAYGTLHRSVEMTLNGTDYQNYSRDCIYLKKAIGGEQYLEVGIAEFNDDGSTTVEDVKLMFKRAIEIRDEKKD